MLSFIAIHPVFHPTLPKNRYVAAPGGAVVYDGNGDPIGDDSGVSAWVAFDKTILYDAYSLSTAAGQHVATLDVGRGFYVDGSEACKKPIGSNGSCGPSPVACLLLVITPIGTPSPISVPLRDVPTAVMTVVDGITAYATIEGRTGAIISDDPWLGTTTDWTRKADVGWGRVKIPNSLPGRKVALQVDRVKTAGSATTGLPVHPVNVTRIGPNTWHYMFSRNIVGHVRVKSGSYYVPHGGNISLNHCEVMNGSACSGLAHLTGGLGTDVHILPPSTMPDGNARGVWPHFTFRLLK